MDGIKEKGVVREGLEIGWRDPCQMLQELVLPSVCDLHVWLGSSSINDLLSLENGRFRSDVLNRK